MIKHIVITLLVAVATSTASNQANITPIHIERGLGESLNITDFALIAKEKKHKGKKRKGKLDAKKHHKKLTKREKASIDKVKARLRVAVRQGKLTKKQAAARLKSYMQQQKNSSRKGKKKAPPRKAKKLK